MSKKVQTEKLKNTKKSVGYDKLKEAIPESDLMEVKEMSKQVESWKFGVYRMGCDLIHSLELEPDNEKVGMVLRFTMTLAHEERSFLMAKDLKSRTLETLQNLEVGLQEKNQSSCKFNQRQFRSFRNT
eukprot:TRINITY_DN671_c0_g2_i1.p1 TRINITY_DN671_c0_g2~~TRINITY_DN671_c0_g2_i1.p1  ORF type:complete len:128 (-),score=34.74 TRINITY_DN671_c0_g2_i1:418-801(-)